MDMASLTITLPDFIILCRLECFVTQIPQGSRMLHSATKQEVTMTTAPGALM